MPTADDEAEALRARIRELEAALQARVPDPHARICENLDIALFEVVEAAEGRFGWMNDAAARRAGYPSAESARGASVLGNYGDPKERAEIFHHLVLQARAHPRHIARLRATRVRRDTGEPFPALLHIHMGDLHPDGMPRRLDCMIEDLRDRDGEDARFRDTEARFRFLFERSPVGILLMHRSGKITRANAEVARILRCGEESLPGRTLADLLHPEDHPTGALAPLEPMDAHELRLRCDDGAVRWVALSVSWDVEDGWDERYAVVIVQDVGARRLAAEEADRSRRLEALGDMAASLAHDYNNLLAGILGGLDLAARSGTPGRWLDQARASALRARDVTHRIMSLARGGAPILEPVDLRALLCALAEETSSEPGTVPELRLPEGVPAVDADPVQLAEVLRVLLRRGRAASADRGPVELSLEVPAGGDARCVRVRVTDWGPPIPPALLPRTFDPFLELPGRGGGIELATAWSTVHRHGGALLVEAHAGGGTSFVVRLPLPIGPSAASTATTPSSSVRILVMDDEAVLREVASALLTSEGYEVETVPDGDAAIAAYARALAEDRPFAAVVLDLTVAPGARGGLEAAAVLRAMDAGAHLVVSSGYSDVPAMASPAEHGFSVALPKPYERAQLLAAVRRG